MEVFNPITYNDPYVATTSDQAAKSQQFGADIIAKQNLEALNLIGDLITQQRTNAFQSAQGELNRQVQREEIRARERTANKEIAAREIGATGRQLEAGSRQDRRAEEDRKVERERIQAGEDIAEADRKLEEDQLEQRDNAVSNVAQTELPEGQQKPQDRIVGSDDPVEDFIGDAVGDDPANREGE